MEVTLGMDEILIGFKFWTITIIIINIDVYKHLEKVEEIN